MRISVLGYGGSFFILNLFYFGTSCFRFGKSFNFIFLI
nr:MAG TPA: hypothetical protein [Caudoviricetes sp.]